MHNIDTASYFMFLRKTVTKQDLTKLIFVKGHSIQYYHRKMCI